MQPNPVTVATVAEEIARYLRVHPHAADGVEGIGKWWLTPRGPRRSRREVEAALEDLLGRGVVRRQVMPDGQVLYRGAMLDSDPESHDQ